MPIFFNEKELTKEQLARYDWAVAEYARIQELNRQRIGAPVPEVPHCISPQSALFSRLLDGKQALPYPPPTSYSYPWYDIIEKPGKYHVSLERPLAEAIGSRPAAYDGQCLVLNQCSWRIQHMNDGATAFYAFLQQSREVAVLPESARGLLDSALKKQPEFVLSYGEWGEFKLSLGRIIRRGRRETALQSGFDLKTLDGGNSVVVKVLRTGAEIHAKADATLANVIMNLTYEERAPTPIERITLASEAAIPRAGNPEGDDLVEYDCDGWVLERV